MFGFAGDNILILYIPSIVTLGEKESSGRGRRERILPRDIHNNQFYHGWMDRPINDRQTVDVEREKEERKKEKKRNGGKRDGQGCFHPPSLLQP